MNCQDLLVNRVLSYSEIVKATAQVFSIREIDIFVADEVVDMPEFIKVLCILQLIEGDFRQQITFYIRDSSLRQVETIDIIGKFCEIADCVGLLPDDGSENPYSMILVKNTTTHETVFILPDVLDEEGKYILA